MRNIEIKAKVGNLKKLLEKAKSLSKAEPIQILQDDTFFNVQHGRFKLREFEFGNAELIFYDRPNVEGPKLCKYEKCDIVKDNVDNLSKVLTAALGTCGKVKKTRQLFIVGQTRLHIDTVKGLGDFVELEVVLADHETIEEGEKIADDLMKNLEINKSDLISGAYNDLIKDN